MRTKEVEQNFIRNRNCEIFHRSITTFVKTKIRRTVDAGAQNYKSNALDDNGHHI